ncbi:hypothetical protein [Burkholderia ubonensis]|uniref:hypothetical protein n=1 Tax=Burkholderia ubonensis TaxID=101571 RepID=UPI000A47F516|nr:hypothetical protein [Burkholderia ubonensis]
MGRIATRIRAAYGRALARLLQPALDVHAAQRAAVRAEIKRGARLPEHCIDVSAPAPAFWRANEIRPGPARAGFAVTSDLQVLPLSASMAGRRVVAVVLFGREELEQASSVIRARIAPNRADPALRDCLQDAVRKCRDSRQSRGE